MNYPLAMAAQDFFVDRRDAIPPSQFADRLTHIVYGYPLPVSLVQQNLFDSHDTDRFPSMFVNPDRPYDGANRPQDNGPDYSPRKPDEEQRRRMIQAVDFQMTFLGAPMIYYGDEAGMWSPDDPSNRQPMVWPDKGPYEGEGVGFDESVFDAYRRAIAVRNTLPVLRTALYCPVVTDDERGVFAFERWGGDGKAWVVLNRSDEPRTVRINVGDEVAGSLYNLLDSAVGEVVEAEGVEDRPTVRVRDGGEAVKVEGGEAVVELSAYGAAVLVKAAGN